MGITTLPAMAEIWEGFDAETVAAGTSNYWASSGLDIYSDENVTGFVAFQNKNGTTMSSSDPEVSATPNK